MPVDRRAAFQLGLLLLAVPVQFLLTQYFSAGDSNERSFALKRVITRAVTFKNTIFSWEKWEGWCHSFFHYVTKLGSKESSDAASVTEEDLAESPAVEILQQVDPKGYFAGSLTPRSPRAPNVKYRVGQVIRHKKWGYRGVIIGWDAEAKAPESWLKEMHPKDKPHWRKLPNYSVLVDTRDRDHTQRTYVAEENIEIITSVKILHPDLEGYFESYDGAQYLLRPWLKKIYPHD